MYPSAAAKESALAWTRHPPGRAAGRLGLRFARPAAVAFPGSRRFSAVSPAGAAAAGPLAQPV